MVNCREATSVVPCVLLMIVSLFAAPFAGAQECPLILTPTAVLPDYTYSYSSGSFINLYSRLNQIVSEFIGNNSIVNYGVAVVHRNETIYTAGQTSLAFRIASVTKTFTALGALMLRDEGLLKLDDPINKYIPGFSILNPWGEHNTTFRELMAHTAGFPLTLCPFLHTCTDVEAEILDQISRMELVRPPWSLEPVYSNLGISVLGHAWEKATSPPMSWEEFVTEKILKPLDMTSSGVNLDAVTLAENPNPWARQDLGWSAPAAQMYSTIDDLAKYLKFLLSGNPHLISKSSIREWTRPTRTFADGKGAYGMPWELRKLENQTDFIIAKAGSINGYLTQLAFYPPMDLGIAITTVYTLPFLPGPERLADDFFSELIPGIQEINQEVLADAYAAVYNCSGTKPIKSPTRNVTVQVLDGTISVEVNATFGLLATLDVGVVNDGVTSRATGIVSLLLKDAAENSFFFGAGPCLWINGAISINPDFNTPNVPSSFYNDEFVFNLTSRSILWPGVGAQCTSSTRDSS
ncbi:hypothetical protein R1flu_014047 [Riccia fluitans]|uniref:Beta-lactamase-related domain-containing protein n=1 Tax=Riccia fluitans TaxID=41844 RepID=A0ABD1YFB5_9MARC